LFSFYGVDGTLPNFFVRADEVRTYLQIWAIVRRTVANSAVGWEHIVPSLVEMGFSLLDTKV
jgi:hypothetical protein